MKYFPFFQRIEGRNCLVVGGGTIAQRRSAALQSAGAIVDILSPAILPALKQLVESKGGQCIDKAFAPEVISKNYHCIVAATDSKATNAQVVAYAREQRVLVNAVDDQNQGDFIFPSIVDRKPLTIAISNSGTSPVLSRLLRQQVDKFVPKAYGDLSHFVGSHRDQVKSLIPDSQTRIAFWEHVLQGAIAEAIFSGKPDEAQSLLMTALESPDDFNRRGEVYLIGAGPGDPDLLTLRAFRLLQQADVVLYDRLVSEGVMAMVHPDAELIYVGKRRDEHHLPQGGINQLLVEHARQGRRVARLKGGDPFIFGRGGEEIQTLAEEEIPFQVVPGISAANGCSAYAGIPLTHRDYAQSVQFVTGQLKNGSIDLDWSTLIAHDKTLVFYMGLKGLPIICESLEGHGMSSDTPVALVEKGTTLDQRVMISTLGELPQRLEREQVSSPSLFIVGQVVSLANKLDWFGAHHGK